MPLPRLKRRRIGLSLFGMTNLDFLMLVAVIGITLSSCGALLWVLLRVIKAP
ncbi:hypothetical protein V5G24_01135 [Xanthobacter sp. VTT E-85241]|jgi:hypothetical protein|uniref:hypothetical protein n=1 Tax=Roseixanthobacter finlandensis TaxID=3119922 RepID=UPI00372791C2